jgi:hypothetical protein
VLWLMVVAALVLPYWRSRKQGGVLAQSARAGNEP